MTDQPTAIKVTCSHIFLGNISNKWTSHELCQRSRLWFLTFQPHSTSTIQNYFPTVTSIWWPETGNIC